VCCVCGVGYVSGMCVCVVCGNVYVWVAVGVFRYVWMCVRVFMCVCVRVCTCV